jgi:hypothetical protein
MIRTGIRLWLGVLGAICFLPSAAQIQSCPINFNFSGSNLTHWEAYTGNNQAGNGQSAIKVVYDSTQAAPAGTIGAVVFPEYNLPGVNGIRLVTSPGTDPFGGFPTIPTINGYNYTYSILLGSTSISVGGTGGVKGGYVRGISYLINVPPGSSTVPYTMTYAYAMVLENGAHASEDQPMARAILSTPSGIIVCASPAYFLPTDGAASDGSLLDSATAKANGFSVSPLPTPNPSRTANGGTGPGLQDVWTKGWTEVVFDLSPYRGQQVSLTFEADNCVPGGHFAYAYFALRNTCAGLLVSGDTLACPNGIVQYSVPALDSAVYAWSVPDDWIIESGGNGNSITVKAGHDIGSVVAHEENSCANLSGSLLVHLYPGDLPQALAAPRDTTICYGGTAILNAVVSAGSAYSWVTTRPLPGEGYNSIPSTPWAVQTGVAPPGTSDYILNIQNAGCPIIVSDTFTVTVVPPIRVNPGDDTLVVAGQPLRFLATSTDLYPDAFQWSPPTGLNNTGIADPVGVYGPDVNTVTYMVKATDSIGCFGTGVVTVTIAKAHADIYVPNAFAPGTGANGLFRPVCLGISSLDYFRVYNRSGQQVFSTSQMGQGWDGRIQGKLQGASTYIWMVQGTDYTGRSIFKKGTMVLIR